MWESITVKRPYLKIPDVDLHRWLGEKWFFRLLLNSPFCVSWPQLPRNTFIRSCRSQQIRKTFVGGIFDGGASWVFRRGAKKKKKLRWLSPDEEFQIWCLSRTPPLQECRLLARQHGTGSELCGIAGSSSSYVLKRMIVMEQVWPNAVAFFSAFSRLNFQACACFGRAKGCVAGFFHFPFLFEKWTVFSSSSGSMYVSLEKYSQRLCWS